MTLAHTIIRFMEHLGHPIDRAPGQITIAYLEDADKDGQPLRGKLDRWDDRSLLIHFVDGEPVILYNEQATTEPGRVSTMGKEARAKGGVARIKIGYYPSACKVGFHKNRSHPALVQCGDMEVHADADCNGIRTGDKLRLAYGINHHSTSPYFTGELVGAYSAGCCVRRSWVQHLLFMKIIKTDPRYVADRNFAWGFSNLDASAMAAFVKTVV